MTDKPRLIEVAFPLKQASIDSVHEKNVRHGHISTLHIWPARRPLAACRAALIATLLPDPGDDKKREEILKKLGGEVVKVVKKKKMPNGKVEEIVKEETVGGVLHWGRENSPDMDWFREEIKKAYGGRAPKVLDPFAGGGAIPLEAMRLGCDVTAIDINPVAWFILKCTLEYPQKLAGQKRPLPDFVLKDRDFMESFFKAQGFKGAALRSQLEKLGLGQDADPDLKLDIEPFTLEADLAWHVRAWGWWVLQQAKKDLDKYYPVIDGKPTVAYLWARTVKCKNCRATIPLLKTRWLCKKDKKRVLLTMEPNADKTGVVFGIQNVVPQVGANSAQIREYDKKMSAGTMTRSGSTCPCCGTIMTMDDIALIGQSGGLDSISTAVILDAEAGKEYRPANSGHDYSNARYQKAIQHMFSKIKEPIISEPIDPASTRSISVQNYGLSSYASLFSLRQQLGIVTLAGIIKSLPNELAKYGYIDPWPRAVQAFLVCTLDKLVEHCTTLCTWNVPNEQIRSIYSRFSLGMAWDFAEVSVIASRCGSFDSMLDSTAAAIETLLRLTKGMLDEPDIEMNDARTFEKMGFDIIVTDPPYYQAISYADLSDTFYIWMKRILDGLYPNEFKTLLTNKVAETVQHVHPSKNRTTEKHRYEMGMYEAFRKMVASLNDGGRATIVFAHKDPEAWETLVCSMIRAGFTVVASWPIQTEREARTRALSTSALASSVWLVCKKQPEDAKPGWDNQVIKEMQENIAAKLRDFWDAGIRGPDFVWAATGPALEAYSKHPVVKKADEPGELLTVQEFLRHVRRIVVDFVVGRVLSGDGDTELVRELDDITTYYLLHRNDFGMNDAPSGASILYQISCGLSDKQLVNQYDILTYSDKKAVSTEYDDELEEGSEEEEEGSRSTVRLKSWKARKKKSMGYDVGGHPAPLIDQVHRIMHLWKEGDVAKVDEYMNARGLRESKLFHQLLQALIELADEASEERSLMESISNHLAAIGVRHGQLELLQGE